MNAKKFQVLFYVKLNTNTPPSENKSIKIPVLCENILAQKSIWIFFPVRTLMVYFVLEHLMIQGPKVLLRDDEV